MHAQTLAFYRLLDELQAAHPGLEIESCSSGGARVDLGVLERTDRVWVSDYIDPHERQAMLRWTAQLVPPEYLGSHIASGRSHTTGRRHDLAFRAGTAIFGHLGIEWDLTAATEQELAELREWIAFYKRAPRPAARRRPGPDGRARATSVLVHGVVAPTGPARSSRMATMSSSIASVSPPLRLRGLDPDRTYRLRPVLVGAEPSGLVAAAVVGRAGRGRDARAGPGAPARTPGADVDFPGAVFSGAVLAHTGVSPLRSCIPTRSCCSPPPRCSSERAPGAGNGDGPTLRLGRSHSGNTPRPGWPAGPEVSTMGGRDRYRERRDDLTPARPDQVAHRPDQVPSTPCSGPAATSPRAPRRSPRRLPRGPRRSPSSARCS